MRPQVIVPIIGAILWICLSVTLYYSSGADKFESFQNGLGSESDNTRKSAPQKEKDPAWFIQVQSYYPSITLLSLGF